MRTAASYIYAAVISKYPCNLLSVFAYEAAAKSPEGQARVAAGIRSGLVTSDPVLVRSRQAAVRDHEDDFLCE